MEGVGPVTDGAFARDDVHLESEWWRSPENLGAQLRDLVAGLDRRRLGAHSVRAATARPGIYAEEFPQWTDVADQTPKALLARPKLGAAAVGHVYRGS